MLATIIMRDDYKTASAPDDGAEAVLYIDRSDKNRVWLHHAIIRDIYMALSAMTCGIDMQYLSAMTSDIICNDKPDPLMRMEDSCLALLKERNCHIVIDHYLPVFLGAAFHGPIL